MIKQEQIEDFAEAIICAAITANAKIDDKVAINLKDFIESLFKAGYRKVPKDSVVLTEREYIDLSRNYVREQIEQARKETAEKILFKFESVFAYYDNKDMFSKKAIFECIEEIVKSIGVEIKEYEK